MPNKDTTPLSLYGNDREYLREQEKTNELLADIAGEEYESPGDIPNGKYVIQKRLLDAAQKKNELLEAIVEGSGGGSGAAKAIGIDYATDIISLKNNDGDVISGSGATLPAYGVIFDPTTGGLTLTKNGTAVQGQTVTIPNYGSPVGVTSSSDMTDHGTIYLYEGTTSGSYTNGHFYYWNGSAWADGGEYAAATVQTDKTLLVEDRAADAKATGEAVGELKTQFEDTISEIAKQETESTPETLYYTTPWHTGGGINANGELVEVGSWAYTDKIAVRKGDVITCDATGGSSQVVSRPIRYLCAYNGDTAIPSEGYSSEISEYEVTSDEVTHVVVTQASFTSYSNQRVVINRTTEISEYWLKQDIIGGFQQSGDLGSGDEFVFPVTNIKQYKVIAFDGNITSFLSIVLGRHVDNADKEKVTIDTTNLTITNTYGSDTVVPHGLTIADNIQVCIESGDRNRLTKIRIITKGSVFEYTALQNITWNADKGYSFVRSVGSVLTDCSASWTSRKINAPIWIFGDSYISYDTARWAYYLIQDGYDESCLMNAYAGENSQNALIAFESLITANKRPKILVWALGMNDGDSVSDDAPNGNWLNVLNTVKSVCESRNIELVLCTIPTTPIINNNYKNAWIKTSGYRYIDFAAGVGATSSGVWFDGLLSTDNVHPTAEGAKTLYYKLLSDFPEIVVNN